MAIIVNQLNSDRLNNIMDIKINTDIPGWMNESELSLIAKLANLVPDNELIIELGTFCGRSAWSWMHNMKPTVTLDLVDVWFIQTRDGLKELFDSADGTPENRDLLMKLIEEHNEDGSGPYKAVELFLPSNPMVRKFKCDVMAYQPEKDPSLVFIDAEHTYEAVSADIQRYMQYNDCLLVGHDFAPYAIDVVKAVLDNRYNRTLISFRDASIWMLVPLTGYWHEQIKNTLSTLV